jgi:hypothetical protein
MPTFRPEDYQVDIRVISQLELFKNKEAKEFSNSVSKELLAGTWPNYTTANIGVGNIIKLYAGTTADNATELVLGTDYKLDGLNNFTTNGQAKIEITNEALQGKNFYADYYFWKSNLKIKDIVDGLLDIMQWPQNKRQVENVIFNTEVPSEISSASPELALGYYLQQDGNKNNFIFNWHPTRDGVYNNYYANRNNEDTYRQSVYPQNFEINFALRVDDIQQGFISGFHCAFALGNTQHSTQIVANGFYIVGIRVFSLDIGSGIRFELRKITNGSYSTLWKGPNRLPVKSVETNFKIRKVGSEWNVYAGNTLIGTWTANVLVNIDALFCTTRQALSILDYRVQVLDSEGNATSPQISMPSIYSGQLDKGEGTSVWGAFSAVLENSAAQYNLSYAVSSDGTSYSDFAPIDLGVNVNAEQRYLKFLFSLVGSPQNYSNINSVKYYFLSSEFLINFINLDGKTILEAIEDLALISGYEFGIDRNNFFFFRQRISSTTPLKTLTDNEIVKVATAAKNLNNLFTKIKVDFGGTPIEAYAESDIRPTMLDKYGIRTKEIDKPQLLNYDNPELAAVIAPQLLEIFGSLKNQISATAVLDLELDLGDIVSLQRNSPLVVEKGATDKKKYDLTQTFYKACKILGIVYNFAKRQMTYTLLDVSNSNTEPQYDFNEFKYLDPIEFGVREDNI